MDLSGFEPLLHGGTIEKRYARHAFFLTEDAAPEYLGFVKEGIFREFSTDRDGKEYNKAFCFAGDLAGSYFGPPAGLLAELPTKSVANPPADLPAGSPSHPPDDPPAKPLANPPAPRLSAAVQALTPGTLLLIPLAEFEQRVRTEETWLRAAHDLAHRLLMKKFQREYQLLTLSAEERYTLLETAHPQLILEIPAFHLASYLGITPVSLSRLRNTRKHKNL